MLESVVGEKKIEVYFLFFGWQSMSVGGGFDKHKIKKPWPITLAGQSHVYYKQPERMTIDAASGALTIRNLTVADEETLTCVFMLSHEHVASVHLKIKCR